ncbi:MAG: hypothetical protein GY932_09015, partial [Arcobacter sp.]|nr:hypothetical protein [Arcobacter sp.]
MKIFKICLLFLITSSILYAVTPEEFRKIANKYKMIDNSKEDRTPINFKTRDGNIDVSIEKQVIDDGEISFNTRINFNNINVYSDDKFGWVIEKYDVSNIGTLCYDKNNYLYAVVLIKSSGLIEKQKVVFFYTYFYNIDYLNPAWSRDTQLDENKIFGQNYYTYIPYNPKYFNPYYNEEKILERLYETGTCDKKATEEANVEVLIGNKWI